MRETSSKSRHRRPASQTGAVFVLVAVGVVFLLIAVFAVLVATMR
jgi:hypothetical protein